MITRNYIKKDIIPNTVQPYSLKELAISLGMKPHFAVDLLKFILSTDLKTKYKTMSGEEKRIFYRVGTNLVSTSIVMDRAGRDEFLSRYKNQLLKMGVNEVNIHLNDLPLDVEKLSLSDFAHLLGQKRVFMQKLKDKILSDLFSATYLDEMGNEKPVFYRTFKGKVLDIVMDKGAFYPFIKTHQKELISLGVNDNFLYALSNKLKTYSASNKKMWRLSRIAARYCSSKCQKDLILFIKENMLSLTYPVLDEKGRKTQKNIFSHVKAPTGKSGIFFDSEALPYFQKKYGPLLGAKAKEISESQDFTDLRSFMRLLGIQSNVDVSIREYLEKNCLDETFIHIDENGNEYKIPCLYYSDTGFLCIKKNAIQTLLKNHAPFFRSLNPVNLEMILKGLPRYEQNSDSITLATFARVLGYPNGSTAFINWVMQRGPQSFTCLTMTENGLKEEPIFKKCYYAGAEQYSVKKEMIKPFLLLHRNELLRLGIAKDLIDKEIGIAHIVQKTDDMILMDDFFACLKAEKRYFPHLVAEIKDKHLSDTYETTDATGQTVKRPIFLRAQAGFLFVDVFENESAAKAFVEKNEDMLISHGINPYAINNFLSRQEIIKYDDSLIYLSDIHQEFCLSDKKREIPNIIREKYLSETYETTDEMGNKVQKPIFTPTQRNGKGIIFLTTNKQALLVFAKRHQKEFGISDMVISGMEGKVTIRPQTDEMISIHGLCRVMSKYSNMRYHMLEDFIEKECMNASYIQKNKETGEMRALPMFTYAKSKNGYIGIKIYYEALPHFLKQYKTQLKKMRMYPNLFIERVKGQKQNMSMYARMVAESLKKERTC